MPISLSDFLVKDLINDDSMKNRIFIFDFLHLEINMGARERERCKHSHHGVFERACIFFLYIIEVLDVKVIGLG